MFFREDPYEFFDEAEPRDAVKESETATPPEGAPA